MLESKLSKDDLAEWLRQLNLVVKSGRNYGVGSVFFRKFLSVEKKPGPSFPFSSLNEKSSFLICFGNFCRILKSIF